VLAKAARQALFIWGAMMAALLFYAVLVWFVASKRLETPMPPAFALPGLALLAVAAFAVALAAMALHRPRLMELVERADTLLPRI